MCGTKKAKPKHQQVFESLSRDILNGHYAPGRKFPSEAALVKRFHVSRITVGRAVHDLQERGLLERFAGSGTYVRNPEEEPRRGLLFGLIIPELGTTEIFEPICQGIAGDPAACGHALLWPHADSSTSNREKQALQLCEQCIERKVSGVFFAPIEMTTRAAEVNREIARALKKAGIPTVFLDRRPEDIRGDLVGLDNQRAGYLAAEHLLKRGARNIGFLSYRGQASSVLGRIAGYRQVLQHEGQIFQVGLSDLLALPREASECDAFVCANDRIAGNLMMSLIRGGIRIPQDVRIVGIDDVAYAALLPVPLTTVHQPCREIGEAALHLLLKRVAHPRMPAQEVLLDCELVVRQSCGSRVAG